MYVFIDKRWLFKPLPHSPKKPLVICQPLSKFDIFTFVVSHAMSFILFFPERKMGAIFKGGPN